MLKKNVGRIRAVLLICTLMAGEAYADIGINSSVFSASINPETFEINQDLAQWKIRKKQVQRFEHYSRVTIAISNESGASTELPLVNIVIGRDLHSEPDERAGLGATFYHFIDPFIGGNAVLATRSLDVDLIDKPETFTSAQWFGWVSRYHFEAMRLTGDNTGWNLKLVSKDDEEINPNNLFIQLTPVTRLIANGESREIQFEYLQGPKLRHVLADSEIRLERVLYLNLWDWFRALCLIIWNITEFFFSVFGNWGISIIILALVIRIITIPITRFSIRQQEVSIKQQALIAPEMKEIKEKYSGVEQSEKIIALYENQGYEHLAPFKSMFGLFIQIPIFAALFNVLGEMWELSGQSFLWIGDLSRSDRLFDWGLDLPYFGAYFNLLPVLMAGITILSTWLSVRHAGNEKSPTTTLFGMGLVFFVLFYSFPAALVLYWLSSNFFQLLQQSFENRLKS